MLVLLRRALDLWLKVRAWSRLGDGVRSPVIQETLPKLLDWSELQDGLREELLEVSLLVKEHSS